MIATDLHAISIAGLSILSVAGGDGLVEKLVISILGIKLYPTRRAPKKTMSVDWQVRN
jgi:hypothetical protein